MADPAARNNPGTPGIIRAVLGLVELWIAIVVLILGAAFVMGLLGANPEASFASWIYGRSAELMTPFNGIFEPIEITGSTVVQTSLLFAMAVYAVVGAVIGAVGRRFQ